MTSYLLTKTRYPDNYQVIESKTNNLFYGYSVGVAASDYFGFNVIGN